MTERAPRGPVDPRTPQGRHLTGPVLIAALGGAAALIPGCAGVTQTAPVKQPGPNVPEFAPAFPEQTRAPASDSGVSLAVEALANGLEHPRAVAVTPDGDQLITERPGRLRGVSNVALVPEPVAGLPEVLAERQGGLLDVAVGPNFDEDQVIFWTYSKPVRGGSATAAACGVLSDDLTQVSQVTDIFVQEPPASAPMHYGARLAFDGVGHVYVTTGERFTEANHVLAQDLGATYGKVVRVTLDGATPRDNPFLGITTAEPTVWSYGLRNIQSADINPRSGELWIAEHGPKGGDEFDLIAPGRNYGWPVVSYGKNYDGSPVGRAETAADGTKQPRYYRDPVIAPGGMAFYQGELFADWQGDLIIASLNPGALVRLELAGDTVTGEERLLTDLGRIRDVAIAEDGAILAITDAADGALLRLTPED